MPLTDTISAERAAWMRDPDWWRQAAVYQIYPRSFADGNGDGVGDLTGVLSRIDYLASLGVDAVWFSPFYPSALVDGGYDVDDYRDIDPLIGSLAQFDEVIAELHARGMKIIIDIVPNHSSNLHVRFQEALAAGRGSGARDRYIFREGLGQNGELPPSDWQSFFGGPAWTRVADGQWYLHLFTPEQPDWNWDNLEVRADFLETLRFWGDRGVDGFRIDVAMGLAKDMSEPLPEWSKVVAGIPIFATGADVEAFDDGLNPIWDRDEVHEIYAGWRKVFNTYDPPLFAVGEVWTAPHRRVRYSSSEGLGQAFNFDLVATEWSAASFTGIIKPSIELAIQGATSSTWVLENHDIVRHPTRYAQPDSLAGQQRMMSSFPVSAEAAALGADRAKAATLLSLALPGSAYIYQGEELGLPEVQEIPEGSWEDPQAKIVDGLITNRDGCRVPLPWTSAAPFFGFSDGASHLPQPGWFDSFSVETEDADASSTLSLYRKALALRHELATDEAIDWLDLGSDAVAFHRSNGWTSVTNFGAEPLALTDGRVVLATREIIDGALPPNATAWLMPA